MWSGERVGLKPSRCRFLDVQILQEVFRIGSGDAWLIVFSLKVFSGLGLIYFNS